MHPTLRTRFPVNSAASPCLTQASRSQTPSPLLLNLSTPTLPLLHCSDPLLQRQQLRLIGLSLQYLLLQRLTDLPLRYPDSLKVDSSHRKRIRAPPYARVDPQSRLLAHSHPFFNRNSSSKVHKKSSRAHLELHSEKFLHCYHRSCSRSHRHRPAASRFPSTWPVSLLQRVMRAPVSVFYIIIRHRHLNQTAVLKCIFKLLNWMRDISVTDHVEHPEPNSSLAHPQDSRKANGVLALLKYPLKSHGAQQF